MVLVSPAAQKKGNTTANAGGSPGCKWLPNPSEDLSQTIAGKSWGLMDTNPGDAASLLAAWSQVYSHPTQFWGYLLNRGSQRDHFNMMERWCFRAEGNVLPGSDQGQDQHLQHPHEELTRKRKILLLLHIEQSVCQVNDYGLRAQT